MPAGRYTHFDIHFDTAGMGRRLVYLQRQDRGPGHWADWAWQRFFNRFEPRCIIYIICDFGDGIYHFHGALVCIVNFLGAGLTVIGFLVEVGGIRRNHHYRFV